VLAPHRPDRDPTQMVLDSLTAAGQAPATESTSASAAHALAELSAGEGAAVQALVQASSAANELVGRQPQEAFIQHVQMTYAPQAYAHHQPVLFPPPAAVYTMPLGTGPHHQIQYVVPPTNALQAHHFYPAHHLEGLPEYGSIPGSVLGKRPVSFYSPDLYAAPTANAVVMASAPANGKKGTRKAGTKRARYDDDFKEQVVREAMRCPEGARIKPTCSRYPGVEPCQLRKWIQKFAQQQQQQQQPHGEAVA